MRFRHGLSKRRILITGGAGFIGSHLCDRMVQEGHDVICMDNYFTGAKSNVAHLLSYPNFEILRFDVREPILLEVDEIYNLACPASPRHYQTEPVRTVETSVMGAVNLLRLARETGAVFLQASTSEVYGDAQVQPQGETYYGHVNPIGPRSCYDEGKRCAETICFDYRRQYDVQAKVVRIFNTYGPRLAPADGRIVSNFILQALHNKPITIYGDGSQTRSLCYVDDMVGGLAAMMDSPDDVAGPVNLGNPDEHTVRELAELIVALTESKSKIIFGPLPEDDPHKRRPDISIAVEKLDWRPSIELEIGLSRTIGYFRRQLTFDTPS
ncbi:UDP-glucuronic acid decarboxylase family protein [Sphingobium nicotianae]|uniref:SDR family oxidoreductase n=1 Tax=Sphingobium nicotianae TaxID=2782607 RepID=A0A9X1DFU1_9SPHN|nr:UDP-glucuronic acid decarboxylase family protein [Sphingobium nicotianae]MBT2189094.1 SDR family oxidoreductase [Sphingobium nicotianae]